MPFCTNCGVDVTTGNFCVKCGTPVAGSRPSGAVAAQPAPLPPAKKASPIVWILVGVAGLFVLIGIAITAAGLFVAHKVTQNPALAIAKIATAANPDIEVVSTDDSRNTVTFKDRKTGETVTMNFDDIQKGKIVFKGSGKEATLHARGDGQNGTLEISSPDGTVKFGAGTKAKAPDWVPAYPGVSVEATFSMQANDGEGGTFHFTTKDAAKDVLSFYERGLKDDGFRITANVTGEASGSSGGMLSAEDTGAKRTVVVTVGTDAGATAVNVVFGAKK
jgi:hypothetical protein